MTASLRLGGDMAHGTCMVACTPHSSANSVQMSSLTAMRRIALHAAAATAGVRVASPLRRTWSSASGAPAFAMALPFWNALHAHSCRLSSG